MILGEKSFGCMFNSKRVDIVDLGKKGRGVNLCLYGGTTLSMVKVPKCLLSVKG